MIIEKNLPQFDRDKVLLLITGEQDGKIFLAHQGRIAEVAQLTVQDPVYSDREGMFRRGAVYESKKEHVQEKFVGRLAALAEEIYEKNKFDQIFLFSPAYMSKGIMSALPKKFSSMVAINLKGNFIGQHPFLILKKIKKEIEKTYDSSLLAQDEPKKLLDKNIK